MDLRDVRQLYAFSDWATDRLLHTAAELSPEQWERELGSSFPSLRATFVHLIGSEHVWLRRWLGQSPAGRPTWTENATPASLRAVLDGLRAERARFLDGLAEEDLSRGIEFTMLSGQPGSGRLGDLLLHVVNHATYHRGQIAAMLRQVGAAPPSTDYYVYLVSTTLPPAA